AAGPRGRQFVRPVSLEAASGLGDRQTGRQDVGERCGHGFRHGSMAPPRDYRRRELRVRRRALAAPGGTTRTGMAAVFRTSSVTDPSMSLWTPLRPCEPMTIRSARPWRAALTISLAGRPRAVMHVAAFARVGVLTSV